MKYRKKPVVIEAYQTDNELDIETLEGTMHASVGDYIITGVRGEQYPCKPDIFEHTYEPADAPTASPWHRVEEELPEPIHPTDPRYKAYLICDSLGYMHVADYTYSKHFPTCYSFHVNGEEETDVKYWMPIEPPKEDA